MTQRLARSSRSPGLRFPLLKSATARQHEDYDRKGDSGWVGEEGLKPAPAKDRQAEIGKGRYLW
jgi:hypothetical protein